MFNKHSDNSEEHNFWMSYTDLMSGFLVVFIIISIVMYVNYRIEISKNAELNRIIGDMNYTKGQLDSVLTELQKNDLRNEISEYKGVIESTDDIKVDFDSIRGSIKITHKRDELFAPGEPRGERLYVPKDLRLFILTYGKAIVEKTIDINKKRGRQIELRIEGHTDPTWSGYDRGSDNSFMENLKLSSKRANAVYQCILYETNLSDEQKEFVKQNMISVGYSFSNRIIDGDVYEKNSYKDDMSRRIEFRIIAR